MDLHQLEYFVQAARAGSFSAASKHLFVTQQAVSSSVSHLEHELGVPLFTRTPAGIDLTEFGHQAISSAESILATAQQMRKQAAAYRTDTENHVNFAYASAALPPHDGPLTVASIQQFKQDYPSVDLRAFELSSDACLSALEHGTADLALVAGRPDPARYVSTVLKGGKLMVAIAANSPLASKSAISFADLKGMTFFPPPDLNHTVKIVYKACSRYGYTPDYAVAPFSLENARSFVREGRGVDLTPVELIHEDCAGVVFIPLIPKDDVVIELCLARSSAAGLNAAARTLREFILKKYGLIS